MVILGGLEVVAAGFLLNEFNKDKVEARSHGPSNLPLPIRPHRPSSAPPQHGYGSGFWQKPQQNQYQQHPPRYQQQPPNLGPQPSWQHTTQPQPQFNAQYPQPGPSAMQHPSTFHGSPQPLPRPYMQSSNTFPAQPQQQYRPSTAPVPPQQQPLNPQSQGHVYIDSKTGKVSHNLYPPDHSMARGTSRSDNEGPKELYGDESYNRSIAGDVNTGLMWSDQDVDNLAYGKDYSDRRRRKRSTSYEWRR
ncbi:hypothetical protein LTR70_003929 [Exophiala xenobiotica]|nr:hypothetical protein LTR70_003929 [Exophiala xenobiotica]